MSIFWTSYPTAYALEPLSRWRVQRPVFAADCGGAASPDRNSRGERRQHFMTKFGTADTIAMALPVGLPAKLNGHISK